MMYWAIAIVVAWVGIVLACTHTPTTTQKRRGGAVRKPQPYTGPAVYVLHLVLHPGAHYEIPDNWTRVADDLIIARTYDGAWYNRLKMHPKIFAHITQINLATGEISVYSSSHAER